jgi:hypothetical protein
MYFETEQHREVEARMLQEVADKYGYTIERCSKAYPVDAVFMRNGVAKRLVEARRRYNSKDAYPTLWWSLQKYVSLSQYSQILPTTLIVEWTEGIYALDITRKAYPVIYMRRPNGRCAADNEPCVDIPVSDFKAVIERQ